MLNKVPVRRQLCSELVSIACANNTGVHRVATGNLEEIGAWSALVLAEAPIAHGSEVRLRGKGPELKGLVESCEHASLGYFVTVRLDPASRWSRQWFAPEHLLELPGYDESLSALPLTKQFPLGIASGY